MAVEYISYIQTENLIKNWNTLLGVKESLALDIRSLGIEPNQEEIDDYIYTSVVGNKIMSDSPPSGRISDTTGNTSGSYQQAIKRDYCNTLECLKKEKLHIEIVNDKLNIGFKRLNPLQQQILNLFYLEKKTWTEVLEELKKDKHFISKHQAQTNRRNSVQKIQQISKITVDMYAYVMKLVEVE